MSTHDLFWETKREDIIPKMINTPFKFNAINSSLRKDERYQVVNARSIQKQCRSILGYAQVINSGNQAVLAGVRTQLVNDAMGTDTFTTEMLWNRINNRINLQDAVVGDYIDVDVILTFQFGGLNQATVQLDFSPTLDGSQVVGPPQSRLIFSSGTAAEAFHYTFKFVVTDVMKQNGIGVMIVSSVALSYQNNRFMIERLSLTTAEN